MIYLEFLNNDETIKALCQNYWQINKDGHFIYDVKELSGQYGINTPTLYKMVKESCIAYISDTVCISCGKQHVCHNRTEFYKLIKKNNMICMECRAKQQQQFLYEKQEEEKKKELEKTEKERKQRAQLINDVSFSLEHHLFDFSEASLKQIIFLFTLIRFSANEELSELQAYSDIYGIRFTPNENYSIEILRQLYRDNILLIDPSSNLSAFNFHDDGSFSFSITEVIWLINSKENISSLQSMIGEIVCMPEFFDTYSLEIKQLCEEVALQECLAYLDYQLTARHFVFSPGEKTKAVFNKLLQKYSVAQMYNFIYRACRYTSDEYQKRQISKKQAANLIPGAVQRYGERAEAEGWEITPYKRDFNLPQSELSVVLYDAILGKPDGGFNLSIENLFKNNKL